MVLDTITLGVGKIAVFQGGDVDAYATVQASIQIRRGRFLVSEHELQRRLLFELPDLGANLYCSDCGEWKPDADFPTDNSRKSRRGRAYECKQCRNRYGRYLYAMGRTARSQQHKRKIVA